MDPQRGNVMLLCLIALAGLAGLGGLTALSVRGGTDAAGHDRFKAIALYAAESGAASTVDFLRRQSIQGTEWTSYMSPGNATPASPSEVPGNGNLPGDDGNMFSEDNQAWFEIEILNNLSDARYLDGEDSDGRVIIRSTGHGPNGATAQVEWEVRNNFSGGSIAHCPTYGQRGLAQDNAGRNDCLSIINSDETATYTPGDH